MAELRADDLGFTIEEASSYLKSMVGISISKQDIAILEIALRVGSPASRWLPFLSRGRKISRVT
jgi:hypothetical protein